MAITKDDYAWSVVRSQEASKVNCRSFSTISTRFMSALIAGAKPQQIKAGYIHPEPRGILAIDQKGGPGKLQQTRPYIFPDEPDSEILWLLAIGGKNERNTRTSLACIDSCWLNCFLGQKAATELWRRNNTRQS